MGKREKKAQAVQKSLQRGVQRWENRKAEKEKQRRTLPTHLPSAAKAAPAKKKAPRKPVQRRPDDDELTQKCVATANRRLAESDKPAKRIKMLEIKSREDQLRERKLEAHTYMKPLAQFFDENPETRVRQLDESSETRNRVACETFPDLVDAEDLLDPERDNWTYRNSERIRNGILAAPRDVVSAKHVAKVLAAPHGNFGPCLMAENGRCMAQVEAQLRHPMTAADAVPPACMGYVTPDEMRAAEEGLLQHPLTGNYCEFCQRYRVNYEAKRRILGTNVTEHEIPTHYYRTGMPGEYSKDAMLQPSSVKGVTRTDGIFGDMRAWNTSDFVPVVGVVDPKTRLIGGYIDVAAYQRLSESERARTEYVPAWSEVGGMFSLNEHALLEQRRIDPYVRSVADTECENSVQAVLREYFRQRSPANDDYSHLFRDLRECAADPHLLERAYPAPPDTSITRWLPNCLHDLANEPPLATHTIYYALLVKINACSELLRRWSFDDMQRGVSANVREKMQLYHDAHLPLLRWMDEHQRIDDASLAEPLYDPSVGFDTNIVFQLYPRPPVHHRIDDYAFTPLVRRDYARRTPLDVLLAYYIDEFSERVSSELHTELPVTRHLMKDLTPDKLVKSAYNRLSSEFERLCMFYDVPYYNLWPALPSIACSEYDALETDEERRVWRTEHNKATLERMTVAFDTLLESLAVRTTTYADLINSFAGGVISDFRHTLEWVRGFSDAERAAVLQRCRYFHGLLPTDNIECTDTTINGVPWTQNTILFAAFVRVFVLEQLHALEPWQNKLVRQSLVLLRNSHLSLVRCITEHWPTLRSDNELLSLSGRVLTLFDLHKPTETRELCPGDLPNLVNGLAYVNFIGDCGMDHHSFIYAQYKKPRRACSGRTFSEILQDRCEADPAFYQLTCLELELSLKGLYRHNTAVPSFARTLALDELFDNVQSPIVRRNLYTFILENQTLVMEATSESLLYMLEFAPHLRNLLQEVYQDWFEWRVNVNMDLVRLCYNETGNFRRVAEIVYGHIKLQNSELVYRHKKENFVGFFCIQVRNFDKERYAIRVTIGPEDRLQPWQRLLVERFVRRLSPNAEIHLEDLKLVGMDAVLLDAIAEIYKIFMTTGLKRNGAKAKKDTSDAAVEAEFRKLTPNQYVLASYFFETLKQHQVVRAIRLTNLNILQEQTARLCERHSVDDLSDVPPYATKVAYSPCCLYIKNAFPLRPGSDASGFDSVMLDVLSNKSTCGKKPPKIKPNTRITAIRAGKSAANYDARVELAQFREEKKARCADTEIILVDLVGEVLYTTEAAKVHKAKRQAGEGERRKKQLKLPEAPLWITPCCGIVYSYEWENITPNGYACGVCVKKSTIADSLKAVLCTSCLAPILGNDYEAVRLFDDVYTDSFRRFIFCTGCLRPWRRCMPHNLCVSFILRGVRNSSFVSSVTEYL